MHIPTVLYITHGYPLEAKDMFSGDDYSFLVKEPWQVVILPRLKPAQETQASPEILPPVDQCLLASRYAKITALLHPDALPLLKREAITCMGQKAPFLFFEALKSIGISESIATTPGSSPPCSAACRYAEGASPDPANR